MIIKKDAEQIKDLIEMTEDTNNIYERLCFLLKKIEEVEVDLVLCRLLLEKAKKDVTLDKRYWKEQYLKSVRISKDIECDLIRLIY